MVEDKAIDDTVPQTKKLSRRCKWYICISATVVVGLAVAIPVGVLVVAPKLGQMAVDMITLHIHNATFYDMWWDDAHPTPTHATADFELTIHSPMFMGAIMKETVITMSAASYNNTTIDGGGDPEYYWTNGPMANYTMDQNTIINGDNHIVQRNISVLFNQTGDYYEGMGALRAYYWTQDAAAGSSVQYLNITAEPTLIALGILKIKTQMVKELVCNCVPGSAMCVPYKPNIWDPLPLDAAAERNKSLNTAKGNQTFGDWQELPVYSVFCEPKGINISNATDWNVTQRPPSWQHALPSVELWTPFGDIVLA